MTDSNNSAYSALRETLAELSAVRQAIDLLWWDRETHMPPGGEESRANQIAALEKLHHARFTSDEVGRLLEDAHAEIKDLPDDSDEVRIVQVTRRDYDRARKLPGRLVEELSRATSEALAAWHKAKEAADFSQFAPFLQRNAELNRRAADTYGYGTGRPYDAFLAGYEPGVTTEQLDGIFSDLKATIVPLVRDISASTKKIDDGFVHQKYDELEQIRFAIRVVEKFGYDRSRGRLDKSAHPFATSFGIGDVRITTKVHPNYLNGALFATMHESGHAMYEQGISPTLAGTPLAQGASYGVHESQSRLWENLVGRGRPFQDYLFPRLRQIFPGELAGVGKDDFYRAVNKVFPSLIRVDADEVTYNLHIMLRYELENEMLDGKVEIDRLNTVWAERMREYLGVAPLNDAEGVLQDIHWSAAGELSFPAYTIGNVISAQLFSQARKDMPDLDSQLSAGECAGLLGWLRENVHRHGRKFTPNELMLRATGEPIGTSAWISYVGDKFSALY